MGTLQRNVGILAWEAGGAEQLSQLEQLPGNILHPGTFPFELIVRRVPGATFETIVRNPAKAPVRAMIAAASELEAAGARAITTSCGFNAIHQLTIASKLRVPFLSSALTLLPTTLLSVGASASVAVLTADSRYLTPAHFHAVDVLDLTRVKVAGLENSSEFTRILSDPNAALDHHKLEGEVIHLVKGLVNVNPNVRAVVFECTDLPPFSSAVRRATGLPVLDAVTMVEMLHASA